jgi:hypothetical protein
MAREKKNRDEKCEFVSQKVSQVKIISKKGASVISIKINKAGKKISRNVFAERDFRFYPSR